MGQKLLIRYFGAFKGFIQKRTQIFLVSVLGQQAEATLTMIHTQAAQKGFVILKRRSQQQQESFFKQGFQTTTNQ